MLDAAKYADLVLLLVDGAFGFEMETFEFLNILQACGACLRLTCAWWHWFPVRWMVACLCQQPDHSDAAGRYRCAPAGMCCSQL